MGRKISTCDLQTNPVTLLELPGGGAEVNVVIVDGTGYQFGGLRKRILEPGSDNTLADVD